jgi:hypothetical protein
LIEIDIERDREKEREREGERERKGGDSRYYNLGIMSDREG